MPSKSLRIKYLVGLTLLLTGLLTFISHVQSDAINSPKASNSPEESPSLSEFSPAQYKAKESKEPLTLLTEGQGASRTYIIYAEQDKSINRPLIIFLHGWEGMNPLSYAAMIDHFARRGAVVMYPVYQEDGKTPPQQVTENAGKSLKVALANFNKDHPDLIAPDKTIYYGFSMGASMALNFSTSYETYNLPAPKALLLAAPGDAHHVAKGKLAQSIVNSLDQIPANLPITMLTSVEDVYIGVPTAQKYWQTLCRGEFRSLILWPANKNPKQAFKSGHAGPWGEDDRYNLPNINDSKPTSRSIAFREHFQKSKTLNMLDFNSQWKIMTGYYDWLNVKTPKELPPKWLFDENGPIKNLGKFDDGTPYPDALIQTKCDQAKN
jgi:dienelactone hydrolase